MKRTWTCPKCASRRVGYFEHLIDEQGEFKPSPRMIGQGPTEIRGLLGGRHVVTGPTGELEAFVCTSCGYVEEYVKNPQSVAWDSFEGFRWCNPPGGTPAE
jgi:predicted nucleic-acid-binding Zn-ribbon protein